MRLSLLIVGALLLSACAGEAIKYNHYLLRSDIPENSNRQMSEDGLLLTHVAVATYLNEAGLVLETAEGQINTAELHLWAEPLRHSLHKFMADEISAATGKDIYTTRNGLSQPAAEFSIQIDQMHGTHDGQALLVASWAVTTSNDGKRTKAAYQFAQKQALQADGYDALVATEKQLLQALAKAVAETL
ncbi:PqiC family protein [Oceanicoccus sagamiensis]|uniref:ABC-type transport auxiliary lipoprotein component domain-containing protein n=1 Tax=Oceanicoccus sagamiensis TaxID=716816 RepID=A0A1X9NAU2_9GAMM|nr:ABC-type transport auxiliary lipoprotein family protein [Oceanicoccus sagamiensis]ARN75158.1 hypothetical protein BST96_14160 [Oceanicoccus sagamiensis]